MPYLRNEYRIDQSDKYIHIKYLRDCELLTYKNIFNWMMIVFETEKYINSLPFNLNRCIAGRTTKEIRIKMKRANRH